MALSRSTILLGALGVTAAGVLVLRRKSTSAEPAEATTEANAPTDSPHVAPKLHAPPKRGTADVGREVLKLTNAFRSRGGSCGGVAMPAVGPLPWSVQRHGRAAAQRHETR